jgi:hypothetical protein
VCAVVRPLAFGGVGGEVASLSLSVSLACRPLFFAATHLSLPLSSLSLSSSPSPNKPVLWLSLFFRLFSFFLSHPARTTPRYDRQ